jgi:hypothetical protein
LEFCFFFLVFFFFFCQVWLQQESILFGLLKVSQARLEPLASGQVGGGWCAGSPAGRRQQHGGGGPPVLSVYGGVEKTSMG